MGVSKSKPAAPDAHGLTERQQKWFASVQASLERDTGKTLEQTAIWVAPLLIPDIGEDIDAARAAQLARTTELTTQAAEDEEDLNLATEARTQHILNGDGPGSGGHLWPGAAGKTPFPASWSATRIMNSISDIATDPTAWQNAVTQGSRTILTGTEDGVDIRVVVDTQTGEIITGYPTNLPRNP